MYNNENNQQEPEVQESVIQEPEVKDAEVKEKKPVSRRAKFRTISGITTALVIAAIIIVNLLVGALSSKINTKIDLTAGGVLDFADETIEAAKSVTKDVNIYSLIPQELYEDEVVKSLDEILKRYDQLSDKISYKKIDTVKNPQFLQKYMGDSSQFNPYSIIFESGEKFKVIDINDTIMMNQQTRQVQSLNAEQKFTSALMYVANEATIKVGVVQGHGEIEYEQFDTAVLDPENYDAVDVNLMTGGIPEDVNMLIIPSPQRDFTPDEINTLDAYFDRGGKAQLIMDFSTEKRPVLEGYLEEWGVTSYPGFVIEESSNNYITSPTWIIPVIRQTDITDKVISSNSILIYPIAMGFEVEKVTGVESEHLLMSSDTSFVRTNLESDDASKQDGDIDGPVVVSTMLTRHSDNGTARFMILGGSGIFEPFSLTAYANKDFYYNAMAYMTDSPESIYIRPKNIAPNQLAIPAGTALNFAALTVVAIPLILLIAGFVVWFKRRHL